MMPHQRMRQRDHISRSGELSLGRQSIGVIEMSFGQSDLLRFVVHHLGERVGAAAEIFRERHRRVIS